MSNRVAAFLTQFHDDHHNTRNQTVVVLGEDEALAFEALTTDAIELSVAVENRYGDTAFATSLVGLFLPSLVKDVWALQLDFLHARYPEAGRTMRVLAEKMVRAFSIDLYAKLCPNATDYPGATSAEKLNWYQARERDREMSGAKLTDTAVQFLVAGTSESLRTHFGAMWKRLHAMAHPSADLIRSGFEVSGRHVFNHFDETLARLLLADAAEVFALLWGMVMLPVPEDRARSRSATGPVPARPAGATVAETGGRRVNAQLRPATCSGGLSSRCERLR